ncbi:MAGUK p55 subfamily member 2-like [Anarrhichthys ocellatus]|uniref:MAGUK p55 subfamily member 2-like n=1 Tax=Anarrhichthys ocellatus TaxID=433405 RepID=UPI0012EE61EA|nr:MAGUK p55 subfamily member 2-like [Anarrhichthys ocellatus]XP_031726988.1 MAGUK p55 subfamily member 2-like [Anarrhichthys ocellatus]
MNRAQIQPWRCLDQCCQLIDWSFTMPVASTRKEPVPQMLDAMSDSTTSSTTANDLDLIFLKGIMESPQVWNTHKYSLNYINN